jgi:amino acid adenylation domain-containing protein
MSDAVKEGYQLSPQQQHLWRLWQEGVYCWAQCAIVIEGELDQQLLQDAVQAVLPRHEIFRTAICQEAGRKIPLQVISDDVETKIEWTDLSQQSEPGQQTRVEEWFCGCSKNAVDFEAGTIVKMMAVRLSPGKSILLVSMPALCADARTITNLAVEIAAWYSGAGPDASAADSPLQYADYSAWQNELISESEAGTMAYWELREWETLQVLRLPFESPAQSDGESELASCLVSINPDVLSGIDNLAKLQEASASDVFLAAWLSLLWRLSQQDHFFIGLDLDGRGYEELEGLMGLLARTVPLRSHLGPSSRFMYLLGLLSRQVREHREHQHYFNRTKRLGAAQLPIGFEFDEWPSKLDGGAVAFSILRKQVWIDRFNLKLSCGRSGNSLLAVFLFNPALFRCQDVEILASQFMTLLIDAVGHPDKLVCDLELNSQRDHRELAELMNETKSPYPSDVCFHELFAQRAALGPDRIALTCNDENVTYNELNERTNQLAHYLRGQGVGPEVLVGVCLKRGFDMVVAVIGVLKSGGAYLPLDATAPQERLSRILKEAEASIVITLEDLAHTPARFTRTLNPGREKGWILRQSAENARSEVTPANAAYVIYTSGSTGRPKGVLVEHRALVNYVSWSARAYRPEEGCGALTHTPLAFDLTITSLLVPLIAGQRVVLVDEREGLAGLKNALEAGVDFSMVKATPSHLKVLSNLRIGAEEYKKIRVLVAGGETLALSDVREWLEGSPRTRIINEYGPTEAVVGCCVFELEHKGEDRPRTRLAIGKPIANVQTYVLTPRLRLTGKGEKGELHIGGECLARGYLGQAAETANRFIPNPFGSAGTRLYRTGDFALYLWDGNLDCLGRFDEQVKIRGYRVEPAEVEAVMRESGFVKDAAVIAAGEDGEEKRLIAYAVLEQPNSISAMQPYLRRLLPDYMQPTAIVEIAKMPLTTNGKLDRRSLPDPDPDAAGPRFFSAGVAPRNPVEEALTEIWVEVLKRKQVGVTDDFFDLGGHSLLVMKVIARVREAFQVELAPNVFFESRTIEKLAAALVASELKPGQTERVSKIFLRVKCMSDEDASLSLQEMHSTVG